MNFVRKITHSDTLKHIVDLPEDMRNQDVELIILPLQTPFLDQSQLSYISGSSLRGAARGALKQFANSDLQQHEKNAWIKGVQEKHEHR
ncbi:hypothetical protein OIN60_19475 [Paenibacillus sp. P96]|uniref:Uncharacterized protein n=1 Tax=Paenibacillus zeirhizosphaerae TaxID=2987519 RepID=A0ABT9FW01_9BACL|nr:hypothetical protein [Paenibacillus sp. P96]MDP4098909.1 hypothetical protein [Paenibacillus sp. P96]